MAAVVAAVVTNHIAVTVVTVTRSVVTRQKAAAIWISRLMTGLILKTTIRNTTFIIPSIAIVNELVPAGVVTTRRKDPVRSTPISTMDDNGLYKVEMILTMFSFHVQYMEFAVGLSNSFFKFRGVL